MTKNRLLESKCEACCLGGGAPVGRPAARPTAVPDLPYGTLRPPGRAGAAHPVNWSILAMIAGVATSVPSAVFAAATKRFWSAVIR